ncbi:MAG: Nif3-like dinuclear metal center hexameric protein [Treponema sp.]|nr:Nif3-like dinuclear metal center hexameric protein [Treponema sp.]
MNLFELDAFFNSFLKKEDFAEDPSRNGIQIQNAAPASREIKTVAFAVDACEATARAAAEQGADALVVHHGLFWGGCETLTGNFYKRAASFIKNDLALIAYHLPLDANNPFGNNYGLAAALKLNELQPFGFWRGMCIGVRGEFKNPVSQNELLESLSKITKTKGRLFPFGKSQIKTVGIISGGAGEDVNQAAELGLDCYITGEFAHEQFHSAKEFGINVISGGHYGTETMGVSLLKEKVEKELGLRTLFIDLPTDL